MKIVIFFGIEFSFSFKMSQLPLFEKKKKEEKKEDIPVSSKTGGWQRVGIIFNFKFICSIQLVLVKSL